jgi:hypothetical protein
MNCEICPSKQQCEKLGQKKFWSMLGRCLNCKAMIFLGPDEHRERNRGHKMTIECVEEWRHSGEAIGTQIWPKARCPICMQFPVKAERWVRKEDAPPAH